MISLKNISVVFNPGTDLEVCALDNINITVDAGKWLTIIGPNGSGKSTFLKVLAGEIKPTTGSIVNKGQDISDWEQHRKAAIFQHIEQNTDSNLVPSMTVEENLLLSCRNGNFPTLGLAQKSSRHTKIKECLQGFEMGLENQLKRQVRFLSGGQRAAIAIAKAILQNAKVILLDEFTASLDPRTAPLLLKVIMNIAQKRGLTIFMVSHDMGEVMDCQKDVLFMNKGKIFKRLGAKELTASLLKEMYAEAILKSSTINLQGVKNIYE